MSWNAQNSSGKPKVFDHFELVESVPGDLNNDQQPEMAADTGNNDICETTTDINEIPSANLGFMTMQSWKKCQEVIATATDNRK